MRGPDCDRAHAANLAAFCQLTGRIRSLTLLSCGTAHGDAGCAFLRKLSRKFGGICVTGYTGNVESWERNGRRVWGSYGHAKKVQEAPFGMVTMHPTSDAVLERPLDYLAIESADAFTYGYMNGMRPRGMLLYSVLRAGDTFEGAFRWGGVSPPDGEAGPHVTVRLRKRR